MESKRWTLPNQITASRIVLVPILWALALIGWTFWLGVGLLVGLLSDILDGQVARRMGLTSHFGAQLDSFADNLLLISFLCWLLMLVPQLWIAPYQLLFWLAIGAYLVYIGLGVLRFRRLGGLHLISARASGVVGYVFMVVLWLFGTFSAILFYLCIVVMVLSSLEGILIYILRPDADVDVPSIFLLQKPAATA